MKPLRKQKLYKRKQWWKNFAVLKSFLFKVSFLAYTSHYFEENLHIWLLSRDQKSSLDIWILSNACVCQFQSFDRSMGVSEWFTVSPFSLQKFKREFFKAVI